MNSRSLSILAALTALAVASTPALAAPTLPRKAAPSPVPAPVLPVAPSVAPGYGASNARPTSADIVGVTQQPFVGISLNDAIGMALLKNPDLAVAASDTRIASYQIQAARGGYDVRFQVEPSVKHDKQAPQNAFFSGPGFQPIEQNAQSIQAGVAGQLPTGGQYNVGISQSRIDDNTQINAFNPYYLASFNVALTQPLLKGFGKNSDLGHQLVLSRINADATGARTLATVSQTIASVQNTYWDLVAAWRNVAIQELALKNAVAQQQSNLRLARGGAAAPIDAVESSTQVAVYQDNVFAALQDVSSLQNALKAQVVDDPADPIWRANLVPTSPVLQLPQERTLEGLLSVAMQNRPERKQIAALRAQAAANASYARNQALPQVDLHLQYQGNGFAGNALPALGGPFGSATPPPYLGGTFGQAYSNTSKFPSYQAGVVFSAPIGNTTAHADMAIAREQERIASIQSNAVDQRIAFEARNALQQYQTALSRLYTARSARQAAEQVYASELRKFKNGASTNFLVTQRQVELVQEQGRELQAQTALNKAIVELQRVDGTILSSNNVTLTTLGQGAVTP